MYPNRSEQTSNILIVMCTPKIHVTCHYNLYYIYLRVMLIQYPDMRPASLLLSGLLVVSEGFQICLNLCCVLYCTLSLLMGFVCTCLVFQCLICYTCLIVCGYVSSGTVGRVQFCLYSAALLPWQLTHDWIALLQMGPFVSILQL